MKILRKFSEFSLTEFSTDNQACVQGAARAVGADRAAVPKSRLFGNFPRKFLDFFVKTNLRVNEHRTVTFVKSYNYAMLSVPIVPLPTLRLSCPPGKVFTRLSEVESETL